MVEDELFYIVRPGTSLRACDRDGDPVRLTRRAADLARQWYDRAVPLADLGPLEIVGIDDWYRRFRLPELQAGRRVLAILAGEDPTVRPLPAGMDDTTAGHPILGPTLGVP